ncbi:MAG: hypothetical protein COT36_00745 [Parcubacteria group bacterium CG08_land_8_20_14_0_20_38_56]|nr:MAG: hypothetical protein COT36_00745 [Parcubacteria group bacterium CG08_land_8_20_14_0_20_38_56]
MNSKRIIRFIIYAGIFLLIFIGPLSIHLIADWLWFLQLGFEKIFITIFSVKILLGAAAGFLIFSLIYINFRIANRLTAKWASSPRLINKTSEGIQLSQVNFDTEENINKFSLILSLVVGFFTGLFTASKWQIVLQYLNSTPFETLDPIFNRDISFYFFTLPFIKMLIDLIFFIVIVCLIGTIFLFILRRTVSYYKGKLETRENTKIHLSILAAILFSLLGLKVYFYKIPDLFYSTTGPFIGASFTDIQARLPALNILMIAAFLGTLLIIINIKRAGNRLFYLAVGFYFAVAVLGGWFYPIIVQKFIVVPNELIKESPYIANNIAATQKAFGLNLIEQHDLKGETELNITDINKNQSTIKNIRLWDRDPLLDTFGQIQEIRTYYDFISVDNDRYCIDGEYRQVMLSPRELNSASLPHRTFINERFTFTHGFGLALSPVNQVTEEGLPVLFIKDLPPSSTIESLSIERPGIYFGELSNDYIFVKTKANEFNYPEGEENVFETYKGNGGVPINSLLRKALFAAKFGSLKILFSNDITRESRVLYYRNIKERVEKALPFLEFDNDPYMVITKDGKLKWIYDAYTLSDRYPYAQFINISKNQFPKNINYIRNSIKAVIDAYDGEMQFYIADKNDPVIQTYSKIFPEVFLPLDKMSDDLRAHIRYPEDIFSYQTKLYTIYHMAKPQIFYNKEDQWEIPILTQRGKPDPIMRHIVMKLPRETKEEFILMIPFTPKKKDNLSAWMVARNDGENYGKLMVYRFPKQKLVFGPKQIVNRINQDPEISRQISLWDQRGSEVIQGNLLVIPIAESLLYIRPLYLRAEGGKIPELKRVIVAYENRIAMEETLEISLRQIFGYQEKKEEKELPAAPSEKEEVLKSKGSLIEQAQKHYHQALQAQRDGNWTLYGEEIRKLGEILNNLKK